MKKDDRRRLARRQRRIARRLERNASDPGARSLGSKEAKYEVADPERANVVNCGGIGAILAVAKRTGLLRLIDDRLHLLKRHAPFYESEHVLSIALNILAGNTCLDDLRSLRKQEAILDMLSMKKIPDATTAGDFLRRFTEHDIEVLMDVLNEVRSRIWRAQSKEFKRCATIDADGVIAPTTGEKKEGMACSYKGEWGYHPLVVSLANTQEPLFLVNRPGNRPSHDDAARWLNKAAELCLTVFDSVLLRGDTDFSLTGHFDDWTTRKIGFVFGYDSKRNLRQLADALPLESWKPLVRPARYEVQTTERSKRSSTKEEVVRANGYKNLKLQGEHVAEFPYSPQKCKEQYRMIVVKKNISMERGENWLWDEVRYFFYITNDNTLTPEEVVRHANKRCNQENLNAHLKNGVHALKAPVHDLVSNWAYMVIASVAWSLKAWFALLLPRLNDRLRVLRMEFKCFLGTLMLIPAQVIKQSRQLKLRLLAYSEGIRLLFSVVTGAQRFQQG